MYTQVDMYSLGVVVFELFHPFSTAMERAVLLRDLRDAGRLPAAFEKANPVITRLIRSGRRGGWNMWMYPLAQGASNCSREYQGAAAWFATEGGM
jgi:hypothetical protein